MQQLVNLTSFSFNSVKRSNVAGNRFELKLGKTANIGDQGLQN